LAPPPGHRAAERLPPSTRRAGAISAGRARAAVEPVMPELAPGVPVRGALCFINADLPLLGKLSFNGYPLRR
jgi:hypothetical protein